MSWQIMVNRDISLNIIAIISREFADFFSSSDSDDDDLAALEHRIAQKQSIPRLENYVERIVPILNNYQFKSHFR